MFKSKQRLGDNPKDFDEHFQGLDDEHADVSGVRPDTDYSKNHPSKPPVEPWTIYPRPRPPHWRTDAETVTSSDGHGTAEQNEFRFEECDIPGPHRWRFEIDDKGVYQVYDSTQGTSDCDVLFFLSS